MGHDGFTASNDWLHRFQKRHNVKEEVGETGASCYGGRLLQGRFMQNYNTDG